MRSALPILVILLASPAQTQIYFGTADAIDGDTLQMGDERFRLHEIDAPESAQTCQRGGAEWA